MKRRNPKTAAELRQELEGDPTFVARAHARASEQIVSEVTFATLEAPVLTKLAGHGIRVSGLAELVPKYAPLSGSILGVLLDALNSSAYEPFLQQLVRSLAAAGRPFDGRPLATLFDRSESWGLRWAIANTVAEARPTGLSEWVLAAFEDAASGQEREMLALAVARLAPRERAIPALVSALDGLPGHVALALGEVGGVSEAALLEERLPHADGWVRRELERAIRKIRKRNSRLGMN